MRFAGTVEIAGYDKTHNPRILDYLTRKAQEMLELPPQPDQEWLGFRPTLPDALPVIGYQQRFRRTCYLPSATIISA